MDEHQIHDMALKAQQKNLIHDPEHMKQMNEYFSERFNQEWGILSLTSKDDNFLMWPHYSCSHTGFCIGLNTSLLADQVQGIPNPVNYDTDFPRFGLFEDRGQSFLKSTFWKSRIWEYEDEYRILKSGDFRRVVTLSPKTLEEIIFGSKMKQPTKFKLLDEIEEKYPEARVYEFKLHDTKFEMVKTQIR